MRATARYSYEIADRPRHLLQATKQRPPEAWSMKSPWPPRADGRNGSSKPASLQRPSVPLAGPVPSAARIFARRSEKFKTWRRARPGGDRREAMLIPYTDNAAG